MNHVLKYLFFITFIPSLVWSSGIDTSLMKSIPMQEAGRLKPYDTFARESLMLIYGKSKYKKRPAHEIVMTWFILPEAWSEKPIVQVKRAQLKETLKLEKTRDHFTPNELFANDRLSLAFQELAGKQRLKQKLDPYYQSVQRLQNQLGVFRAITSGMSFRWVPPKDGKEDDKDEWSSLHNSGFPAEAAARFQTLTRNFVGVIGANMRESISEADKKELQKSFDESVVQFMASAKQVAPDKYPSKSEIAREVHYNSLDPFMWSWILYLLGVLLLSVAWYSDGKKTYSAAWVLFSLGLILHTYGFYLRVMIAGRPPVSNMYETVIWVSWGGILFSMMIEAVYKQRYILLGGGIGGILCLVLASLAPTILDASISPLEPVLVSNFWLLIHVLTITISYSAFLLAFVLGDIGLFFALRGEDKHREKITGMANAIYRSIQIGVVLLAAGIILGGIWADYSWGRFWGWDPKETWALIALLGYLAILHGRLAGWLRPFGMCVGGVVAFSLVIMAWYGVNFVLGAGLHSYGFGGGGVQYVSAFVAAHFIYVTYALIARNSGNKSKKNGAAQASANS